MAISFRKYIDITSGVGAGAAVARRQLIARIFSDNTLIPVDQVLEFDNPADVSSYFGSTSEEYQRAAFYFGFISKNITRPKTISYGRYASVAEAPRVYGSNVTPQNINNYTSITNGSFSLTMGNVTEAITNLDFSAETTLAGVASIIQLTIRSFTTQGALWTNATVVYDAVRGAFVLTGGATGDNAVSIGVAGTGTDIGLLIGWRPESMNGAIGAIWSPGVAVTSLTDTLDNSVQISNNFGSFLFMDTLTTDQLAEIGAWNNLPEQNLMYQFMIPVALTDAQTYYDDLNTYGGLGITIAPISTEFPEMIPMMILAAIDYTRRNSTQNFMFQSVAGITPSVIDTATSDALDAISINYYGTTQTAGQNLSFYQRGVLMGLATNPLDMNTYANEQWLKDAIAVEIMNLLMALAKVSANVKGRGQVLAVLQSVINEALTNGVISVGKTLNIQQQLYITELTGDPEAWYQVQNIGYWVDVQIVQVGVPAQYQVNYTLVYSKDDVIRKVNGTDILI